MPAFFAPEPDKIARDPADFPDFINRVTRYCPLPFIPFGAIRNDEHTLKAGLNYRFNWPGSAVARY